MTHKYVKNGGIGRLFLTVCPVYTFKNFIMMCTHIARSGQEEIEEGAQAKLKNKLFHYLQIFPFSSKYISVPVAHNIQLLHFILQTIFTCCNWLLFLIQ